MKQYIKKQLNKYSLVTQLVALISIVFTFIIVLLIVYNYISSSKTIMHQQTEITTTMLRLETQNLDSYLAEIDRYSLLLRQNSSFINTISTPHELSYSETSAIGDLLAATFDNRNDLIRYRIYLIQNEPNFEITSWKHMVQTFYGSDISSHPQYEIFTTGPFFNTIEPSKEDGTLFTYYRTIIRIENQEPLAVVELTIDDSYISSLAKNYVAEDEYLFMIDDNNRLFYSSNDSIQDTTKLEEILDNLSDNKNSDNYFTATLNNVSYLVVHYESSNQNYHLISLKPLEKIEEEIKETRNVSLLLAAIAISFSICMAMIFIRLITKPLSDLAHRLRHVGKGNFTTTTNISGSIEISNLAEDFNSMITHIDSLIKKNYVSELNEKTARLIALEAQLNPHFLYNTLQAINSEAITSGNGKIYSMVNALASMLRYSIKDGVYVKLEQELKYVSDYLFLQESRFDERLIYHFSIDSATENLFIPKISILTLIENSIIHGMDGDITSIEINVSAELLDDFLVISVEDNGCGMSTERLIELQYSLQNTNLSEDSQFGIGLANLSSRLQLLYNGLANLKVDSVQNEKTIVILKIPVEYTKVISVKSEE